MYDDVPSYVSRRWDIIVSVARDLLAIWCQMRRHVRLESNNFITCVDVIYYGV